MFRVSQGCLMVVGLVGFTVGATFSAEPVAVPQVRSWQPEDFSWLPRRVVALPKFKTDKPRFTWWALGTGTKSVALMAWDESGGSGTGYDTVSLDRDFDGDLTEEGESQTGPLARHTYEFKEIAEADGQAKFSLAFVREKGVDHPHSRFRFILPDPADPAAKPVGYESGLQPAPLQIAWSDSPATAPVYRLGTPPMMVIGKSLPGQSLGACTAGTEFEVHPVKAVLGSGTEAQMRFYHAGGPGGAPLVRLWVKAADGDVVEEIPFTGHCGCGGSFVQRLLMPRRVPDGEHEVAIRLNRAAWNGGPAEFVFPLTVRNPDHGREFVDPGLAALRGRFAEPNARFASLRRAVTSRDLHKTAADEPLVAGRTWDTFMMSSSAHWDAKIANFGAEHLVEVGQRQGTNAPSRGLVKFDLSGIPAGAKVLGAMLRLTVVKVPYVTSGSDARIEAYAVRRPWNELPTDGLHCSWYGPFYKGNKQRPESADVVFWKQGGCEDPAEDRYPDPAGSVTVGVFPTKAAAGEPVETFRMVTLDVADTVRQWASGSLANHGLLLVFQQSQGAGWLPMCSSEHPECMFRPTLILAYEGGAMEGKLQPAPGEDLEAARAAATRRGVPLAIKFYSPLCPISTEVNAKTFKDPAVTQLCAARTELVSLKVEDHPRLAQELGAVEVPMLVVLTPDASRPLATVEANVLRDPKACATRLTAIGTGK